jgi:threonine synthase
MWRYSEGLPVDERFAVSFEEGFTPLLPVDIDGREVLVKQEQLFTTGSYKDRGASVLISKARELGIEEVVEDSSGNAGAAIAAYCAKAGIVCRVFVPEETSPGKLAQIAFYGAKLVKVPGGREAVASAALKAAEDVYYASHSWNPFFFHGTKTIAFEIAEQLGWRAPDTVILPVGNGTLLLGAYIGFTELMKAGMIGAVPKLVGVQAAACAPLAEGFSAGGGEAARIFPEKTMAEGIAIAKPVRGGQILAAVRKTGGGFITVTDGETEAALILAGRRGYYIEPTSGAALAGVMEYLRTARPDEGIVTVFSGHGLKATEKMAAVLEEPG